MKQYQVTRSLDGVVEARVLEDGVEQYRLPHLVHHSPDGFEYGYGGSGPSDLARSIIGDYLSDRAPNPWLYQAFKRAFVAAWNGDETIHSVTEAEIAEWLQTPEIATLVADQRRRGFL